jgi:hypothetical protein
MSFYALYFIIGFPIVFVAGIFGAFDKKEEIKKY